MSDTVEPLGGAHAGLPEPNGPLDDNRIATILADAQRLRSESDHIRKRLRALDAQLPSQSPGVEE